MNITLEDLIAMCDGQHGQRFKNLKNNKTFWTATARPKHPKSNKYPDAPEGNLPKDIKADGKTPREAVENLLNILSPQGDH